jgi:hypothetical protein
MKTYLLAAAVASVTFFSLSVQAAPLSSSASGVQNNVPASTQPVAHCRYYSGGWGCGYGGGYGGHSRYWSHRRHGSYGY